MIIQMKKKEKILNDPIEELCNECKKRTVMLTLEALGIPSHATEGVLKKIELLERRNDK